MSHHHHDTDKSILDWLAAGEADCEVGFNQLGDPDCPWYDNLSRSPSTFEVDACPAWRKWLPNGELSSDPGQDSASGVEAPVQRRLFGGVTYQDKAVQVSPCVDDKMTGQKRKRAGSDAGSDNMRVRGANTDGTAAAGETSA